LPACAPSLPSSHADPTPEGHQGCGLRKPAMKKLLLVLAAALALSACTGTVEVGSVSLDQQEYARPVVSASPSPYASWLDALAKRHGMRSSMRLFGWP